MSRRKKTAASDDRDLIRRFREYLAQQGLKYTRPREIILLTFFRTEGHVAADELFDLVRQREEGVGFATVHRTLKLLVDAGFALEHRFGGRLRRYEPALKRDHHDHLICTSCDKIVEFEEERIEKLQEEVAARFGFEITDHNLELFGVCGDCQKAGKKRR